MFDLPPEAETPIIIPVPCEGCGVQCHLVQRLESLAYMKTMMEEAGEQLVGSSGAETDTEIESRFPEQIAEVVKIGIRKSTASTLDHTEEEIASIRHEIDANALSCSGVLKMRATKGDVTYTVNVCTSANVYVRDGRPEHLPTHVRATSADKS